MKRETIDKARRLSDSGAVTHLADADAYVVQGDSARHVVVISADVSWCSCPAQGDCSHKLAASIQRMAQGAAA